MSPIWPRISASPYPRRCSAPELQLVNAQLLVLEKIANSRALSIQPQPLLDAASLAAERLKSSTSILAPNHWVIFPSRPQRLDPR